MKYIWIMSLLLFTSDFKQEQQKHQRVKDAYCEKEEIVKGYFLEKKLSYGKFNLFIRAFKKEMKLEVWIKENTQAPYTLLHTYDICSASGILGPKRKEGDYQVPEGVYEINHFNPLSSFHLSLGLNYPNASDRILSDRQHPGSAIYVHGNCVTVGCIPITDDKIKELYILAVEARNNGQQKIPIHIFPSKLNDEGMAALNKDFASDTRLLLFWENLKIVYTDFEKTKHVKTANVNAKGEYYLY